MENANLKTNFSTDIDGHSNPPLQPAFAFDRCAARLGIPIDLRQIICAYISLPLNNEEIRKAVKLWVKDPITATLTYGHISDWDTSSITTMKALFSGQFDFNNDISRWDVSNVIDMSYMFQSTII